VSASDLSRGAAPTAEPEVEAGFHDVFGLIDPVDERPAEVLTESEIASTKVVVIVLDEPADKVSERVLTTDADCPAAAGIAH
jgi:hypothetical protein